jgi:diguanylate cyclase (GGDEF)-like protein
VRTPEHDAALEDPAQLAHVIAGARDAAWEDPVGARAAAVQCQEAARARGHDALRARALAVQGTVALNRADLRGAWALSVEADELAERSGDTSARLEVAALRGQLSFFAGANGDALRHAGLAVALADATGDARLRLFARRAACLVFGNLDAPGWGAELDTLLRLSVELGDRWHEAVSRNDLAHHLMVRDDVAGAERELDRGLATAAGLAPANTVVLVALHCTRAELRLRTGRPADALADARRALAGLATVDEPNPYLLAVSVRLEVEALIALGKPEEGGRCGERALARLGDRVPQARGLVLEAVATALRQAGRLEEAYDVLAQGSELERRALQELTELRLGSERAVMETEAVRRRAEALARQNDELERILGRLAQANAALEERTGELEGLQETLRDQADRDPLTGLHNRRHLTAAFARLAAEPPDDPFSVAVLDLDRFKAVNDAFGHAGGDQVLVRTAVLLRAVVRTSDVVARSGGEEFVLLMPHTGAAAAAAVCERLLAALRAESWQRIGAGLRVTASAGIATWPDDGGAATGVVDPEAIAAVADERLFAAKRGGRDRVVGARG